MKKVHVYVTPKKGVLDPQGKAIASSLKLMNFNGVGEVRLGKFIELELENADEKMIKTMCEKLLANTVIEDYRYEIVEAVK